MSQPEPSTQPRPRAPAIPSEAPPTQQSMPAEGDEITERITAKRPPADGPISERPVSERRGPPPLPAQPTGAVELTPSPPPAPAKAVAQQVAGLRPLEVMPARVHADEVGEFIGEVRRMTPAASFGAVMDGSLGLGE